MKAFRKWLVLVPVSLLVLTACSGSGASGGSSPPSSAPGSSAPAPAGGNLAVTLKEWSVMPTASTVPTGSVAFVVTNKGKAPHEFVVFRTDTLASDIPVGSFEGEGNRIDEDTAGTNVGETGDLAPGSTKTLTIDLKPGHYVFLCNLPGHYGLGMHTDFTVS